MDDKKEEPRCFLSLPNHPHTLTRRPGNLSCCRTCNKQKDMYDNDPENHYYCTLCDVEFHVECYFIPKKITHPYHNHPLIFTFQNSETGIIYDSDFSQLFCGNVSHSVAANQGNISDRCSWCEGKFTNIFVDNFWFYRCSICNFCLDLSCSENIPSLTIKNPKSHHHPLFFFPRPLLVPCDACGLVTRLESSLACFQCNYVVHESCINLPRVIKITRHPHRLYFTPFLSPTTSLCRICYKTVDIKYGQYSCNREDCCYVVHSKCVTHEKVWDMRELEWEPEEPDQTEDIVPFKKVGDGMIKYFCHDHHLILEKYDSLRDATKKCQACILRIDSNDFYNCSQCEFFLHEVCAGLPRILGHALHKHPLVLDPSPLANHKAARCSACARVSTGFKYKCSNNDCEDEETFRIDVLCSLVPEYFTHKSHEHPLFIDTSSYSTKACGGCKGDGDYLKCTVCDFEICYKCVTLPNELYYKFDAHLLTLRYGESVEKRYWCEVCERELYPEEWLWFYTCDKCCITIHVDCIFTPSVYIKSDYTFYFDSEDESMQIVGNNSNTRPICCECKRRCRDYVYYKFVNRAFCSWRCTLQYGLTNCLLKSSGKLL
ncbi:unnamed protein product [Cochlearia groenlandica]